MHSLNVLHLYNKKPQLLSISKKKHSVKNFLLIQVVTSQSGNECKSKIHTTINILWSMLNVGPNMNKIRDLCQAVRVLSSQVSDRSSSVCVQKNVRCSHIATLTSIINDCTQCVSCLNLTGIRVGGGIGWIARCSFQKYNKKTLKRQHYKIQLAQDQTTSADKFY